jgi:hypothetical protein
MKRALLLLIAGTAMFALSGCCHPFADGSGHRLFGNQSGNPNAPASPTPDAPCRHGVCECAPGPCPLCGGCGTGVNGTGLLHCCGGPAPQGGGAPGGVAYPYYTVRGPRDYFTDNPPGIGP